MRIHIKGSGADALTKRFERDFDQQLFHGTRTTYEWTAHAFDEPPGWDAIQRAMENAVITTVQPNAKQAPDDGND